MITNGMSLRPSIIAFFVILSGSLLASCAFKPSALPDCNQYDSVPLAQLTSQESSTVFETPGTIIAIHGSGSAKLDKPLVDNALFIKVEQSVPIPPYANHATVFLNGWRLNYLGDDHHVLYLGSLITKIRNRFDPITKEFKLTWDALGLLRDDGGHEGYSLSYKFTVVAWNDRNLSAAVDDGVVDANDKNWLTDQDFSDNYFVSDNAGTTTALSSFFSFVQNSAFEGSKTVAVLPRGFGFGWTRSDFGFRDHHLLQAAYNLDHSEIFIDNKKQYNSKGKKITAPVPTQTSVTGLGFVSWDTYALFKDNDTRRDYGFIEMVSAMGGSDVGVFQPPFSMLPSESTDCGSESSPPVRTEEVVIENVPFEYALPMLTGWDLEYSCSDQHVKEIGIWIDQWSYKPPLGGSGGILQYRLSSVLRDNDNWPDFAHSHNVAILGLRPVVLK